MITCILAASSMWLYLLEKLEERKISQIGNNYFLNKETYWRKWGILIIMSSTALSALLLFLRVGDYFVWGGFFFSGILVGGATFTNFKK